jgi:two-component system, cell cycle sensor histidine kinase and response regulator CckA
MLRRLIGEDVELVTMLGTDLAPVRADPTQIEQVIVNLAVNARDAMPDGGVLSIETREVVLDANYAAEHSGIVPGTYACLSVTDTGTGIDRETQSRIFDPFFTTKEVGAGTGLGLATVHGIVVQSGGHVEVYSEPGIGTSFKVYLPGVADAPALPGFKPARTPERLTGDETVLVCEDDPSVRVLLQTMLRDSGYDVLSTSGPMEALELAAGHPDPIHVLVTDVVMPQLSGPQLVQRLLPLRPGVRILFLSGYSPDTIRGQGLPEDSAFLQKPFDAVSLVQRIRALLDTPAEAAASTDR